MLCDGEGNDAIDIDHAKVVLAQCRDWKKKRERTTRYISSDGPNRLVHPRELCISDPQSMDPLFNSLTFSRTLRGGVSVGV